MASVKDVDPKKGAKEEEVRETGEVELGEGGTWPLLNALDAKSVLAQMPHPLRRGLLAAPSSPALPTRLGPASLSEDASTH